MKYIPYKMARIRRLLYWYLYVCRRLLGIWRFSESEFSRYSFVTDSKEILRNSDSSYNVIVSTKAVCRGRWTLSHSEAACANRAILWLVMAHNSDWWGSLRRGRPCKRTLPPHTVIVKSQSSHTLCTCKHHGWNSLCLMRRCIVSDGSILHERYRVTHIKVFIGSRMTLPPQSVTRTSIFGHISNQHRYIVGQFDWTRTFCLL